jgi:catechol 2,3-dioxygenase-like lactoylglutathione lyase family enzyme
MNLSVRRIILFVQDVQVMGAFYRDALGLKLKPSPDDPKAWLEFEAGACSIALHDGGVPNTSRRAPKIGFYVSDVSAARAILVSRGVKMGRVQSGDFHQFCDGKDPEGNAFSVTSRP